MKENDIAINDLYQTALPDLKSLQKKNNVHFLKSGSIALGKAVGSKLLDALNIKED